MNAWENEDKPDLHSTIGTQDIEGDDLHDETYRMCKDGDDLICCDGYSSSFHVDYFDIQEEVCIYLCYIDNFICIVSGLS